MERIIITHFVDPHRFWFRTDEPFLDQELLDFRANLNKAMQRADRTEGWTPAVGEVVAYFQKHTAMLERAVVNTIGVNTELTLWLVDIGHPQRARRDEVRPIPKNVKMPEKKIIREGGIFELVPAKRKFNLQTLKVEMVDCGKVWSEGAIELMKEAIEVAEGLLFEAKSFPDSNVVFGNLTFLLQNGRKLPAVDLLGDYSRGSEHFLELISQNLCTKLRLKNSGNDLEASPASQDYVNNWIEKVVDVHNDNFDESVSTFHTPAIPAAIPKYPEMDEWDCAAVSQQRPVYRFDEVQEEDEFSSVPSSQQLNGRPEKLSNSSVKTSSSTSECKSLVEARRAQSMKRLVETLSDKDLEIRSGRAQLAPQPAGMINPKDVPNINRPKHNNPKSPLEVNMKDSQEKVKALGDVAIAPTAKKRYQRLLAHGENSVKMIEKISDVPFRPEVHQKLKCGDVHRVQCLTWPHIFRGGSIIVIGHKKSGKTLAYLPMLFTRMMNDKEKEQAEMQVGARAIVICSSSKNVYKTSKTFDGYNDRQKMKLSVLPSCNPRDTRNHVIELQNGVDILFTTAPGFKRLWQCAQKETVDLLTLDEVKYLIVDDYDEIIQHFRNDLKFVLETIMSVVDENDLCRAEVVITSRKWMPKFKEFWKKFDNPMLCIASGVEAALYGGGKFTLDIMDTEQKVEAIRDILITEEYFIEPTMIVCNTAEEVNYLANELRKFSVSVMTFTEPSREELMVKDQCVIICTDASLMDINMRRIQNLIHFSLPAKWSTFDRRFVVCFDYYEDQVVCEDVTKSPVKVHIFLDQHNDMQLPKMIYFMKTRFSSVEISDEILECARATVIRREEGKVSRGEPLCSAMMEFGECKVDQIDCPYRHRFSIADAPSDLLPKKGIVRMKILSVVTPLHFMCNILHSMESYIDPYDKWIVVNASNRFSVFQNDLNRHMMTKENQLTPASADVQEHDIYVLPFDENFLRVRVLSVMTEKGQTFVSITGVDIHKVVDRYPAQELLDLPEEFKDFPHQLINVRLFGLVPNDHEMMWDSRSTNTVKDLVKSVEESDKKFFIGEVELTLKDTIYVKSLLCVEFIDSAQANFAQFSLKAQILKDQIAVEGEKDKIQVIKQLAQTSGILAQEEVQDVEVVEKPQEIEKKVPDIEKRAAQVEEIWMSLQEQSLVNVNILHFASPEEFYVQDLSKAAEMRELYGKVKEFVGTAEDLKSYAEWKVGDHCLVLMEGSYFRGKVWQESSLDDEYNVFLVDEGIINISNTSEMYEISPSLVKEYPFYAIRCSLLGVNEKIQRSWDDEGMEIFERFINRTDRKKVEFYAYAQEKRTLKRGESWKITNFSVILVSGEKDPVVINRNLIEENYGVRNEEKWHFIEKFIENMDNMSEIAKKPIPDYEKMIPVPPVKSVKVSAEAKETEQEPILDSDDTVSSGRSAVFHLESFFPPPSIEWRQTDRDFVLNVNAVDMKDYSLSIKSKFLTLMMLFEDKPQHGCVINFFGCIEPERSCVKVRGNTLCIRLCKSLPGRDYKWPCLNDPPEKVTWLREALDIPNGDLDSDSEESGVKEPIEKLAHYAEDDDEYSEKELDSDDDNELCYAGHYPMTD